METVFAFKCVNTYTTEMIVNDPTQQYNVWYDISLTVGIVGISG